MAKTKTTPPLSGPEAHKKELVSLLRDNARRHGLHTIFSDFVELSALSISNAVDKLQFEAREARYMEIIKRYERDEVERFPRMFAVLVDWMECGFADCLGDLFMALDLGNAGTGQFFTPYSVSSVMAQITLGDVREQVERTGFLTLCEPACGAGGMVIAAAEAIHSQGVNYQQVMHATAIDIDATAVHMTYLQLALRHVPAIIIHGNALAVTEWAHWVTPAHVLGHWDFRLRRRAAQQKQETTSTSTPTFAVPVIPKLPVQPEGVAPAAGAKTAQHIAAQRVEQLGLFA